MKKQILTAVVLSSLFMVTGCKEEVKKVEPKKTTYNLKRVEEVDFTTSSQYSASIRGRQDIEIYPQVGGYLSKIYVTEGQSVKKGQVLFTIEQAPFKAAYQGAKAAVLVAESGVANGKLNYDNATSLFNKNIISQAEMQLAQNNYNSAKAQLELAKAQELSAKTSLDFTTIKSPSDGVVGKLPYRQGALVSAALPQSLTTISDNSQMYVYFSMGENQILDFMDIYGSLEKTVESLPEVELVLNNGTTYNQKGRVESVSGVINATTGSVSLRASFPNEQRRLLSGSAGSVVIKTLHENAIVVPKTATYEMQDRYFVYKVVDGKAQSTKVTLSKESTDNEFLVLEGLNSGDVIIATGAGLVHNGAVVNQ